MRLPHFLKLGDNLKTGYDTLEDAYRDSKFMSSLRAAARSQLFRRDMDIDVVHDAFARAAKYSLSHDNKKISSYIMFREVARACRRANKFSNLELPSGDNRLYGVDGVSDDDTSDFWNSSHAPRVYMGRGGH